MLYFLNERRQGTRNLQKDLPLGHLQAGVGKNSKDLAILILEFDDVTVKPSIVFVDVTRASLVVVVVFVVYNNLTPTFLQ